MNPSAPATTIRRGYIGNTIVRVIVCISAVLAITAALYVVPLRDRGVTAALTFLFLVLIVSSIWGYRYSLFLSFLGALGFSWLLPPVGRFWLSDSRDVATLFAFLIVGIIASHFSDRARKEALNANQRHAEAVAAQTRFADLVNSVDGIVWEADAETFAFSFVSEQAERILGYPIEKWLNEPTFWKDHLHPEDREGAVQFCLEATAQKRSLDVEYRMIADDGRVVWIRGLVTVVVENGRATRLRGVLVDITTRKRNEEALREQAKLLDLTHDAIFVRDMNGVIQYWNRGAEEFYGWKAEQALGKVTHDLLQTAFPAPLAQIQAELLSAGRWEGELAHTKKDGTTVVVASRWSLQRDGQGAPFAILETNNDISAGKRAEQAREEIEEQWRAAFESNPTMYFIVDGAGTVLSVNAFGAEQLGYNVDELIGQPVLSVFYEPDRRAVQDHANACFKQPGQLMRWEARKIRKDGAMRWVRETAKAVSLKKRPVLLVICEDITEQKRAEDALRRSEKELCDVIETIPVMAFSIRTDGSTEFVNRRVLEYTGLSAETISGPGWQSTVHTDDLRRHMNKWRASLASGEPFENEVRHRDAKGEYRWFLIRSVPLRDEHGSILKWYGTLTDIEDRKLAEAMLAAEKRLLEMIATGVALKEILNALCLVIEELRSGTLASVLLLNPDGVHLDFIAGPSLPNKWTQQMERLPIGPCAGSCGTAAYRGSQVIVSDIATDPLWEVPEHRASALKHQLRASWSNPVLSSRGKVLGTFCMYYREPRSPSSQDLDLIEVATHIVQVAIERDRAEEAVRRSEKEIRDAIQAVPGMPFSSRTDGSVEFVNRRWLEYSGLSVEDTVGSGWQTALHPDDLERHVNKWRESMETGQPFENEARHRSANGEYRWFLVRAIPLRDENGNILKWYGLLTDIEDRKRAEEALRRSETYLAEAQRLSKTGSWAFRPGMPKAVYWSEEMFRIWGFNPQQVPPDNETAWQRIHPEDLKASIQEQIEKASTGSFKVDFENEFRIVLPEGTVKYVHGTSHPVFDETGKVIEYVGTSMDVTERKRAEHALRDSEELKRRIIESSTDCIKVLDLDGNLLFMSSGGQQLLEIGNIQPYLNTCWIDFWQPEDRPRISEAVAAARAGGIGKFQAFCPSAKGAPRWWDVIIAPICNADGQPEQLLSVSRDITERKRAEETLRRSEAYLAEAQKLTHTGSWAYDPRGDRMLYCSEEVYRIFGVDPKASVPSIEVLLQRVHPEDRDRVRAESVRGGQDKREHTMEYRLLLPDGTIKYVASMRHPVFDGAGELVEIIGTMVDVTERKRAEEELRKAETRFRTYVDHATDALFVYDEQEKIVDANREACESLGYTREELIGMTPREVDPGASAASLQWIRGRLEAGEICTFETSHRRKDGTEFPVEVRVRMLLQGDRPLALALARDTTGRKRAEEERDRLRRLQAELARINRLTTMGELTASVAHEINQPIAAAVTNANTSVRWLANEIPNIDEAREAAKRAAKDATRAADIINRIRSLFKKGEAQREWVDVNEIIDDMIVLLRSEAIRCNVSIHRELSADLPHVMADRVQLQQVLMNLMANSIDAMKGVDGTRELVLTAERDGSDQLLVSVCDTGVGLPPDASQIFSAFFTTKPHGTGMGLAISRTIIESHGGRLWASANSGRGATFCFTLPIKSEV